MSTEPLFREVKLSPSTLRKTRARTVPVCAACGRRLRPNEYVSFINALQRIAHTRKDNVAKFGRPRIGVVREGGEVDTIEPQLITADGLAPSRGFLGDNIVCNSKCGWLLAIRILVSVPGVLALLPAQWRHR